MKNFIQLSIFFFLLLIACENENKSELINKENLNGVVQKGPFINGTSITLSELKNNLSQTGKSFSTEITNSKGSYDFSDIELISNFISLKADGFYYNEILGEQSSSQISMVAISDISNKSEVNINLLSHLEKSRVEYLFSQGEKFSDAKRIAQSEILAIFKFSIDTIDNSDALDITKEGNGNAALLAASLILQGQRTEAELTVLLSNISTDLKEDGVLNSSDLGTQLINQAIYLDATSIRSNLEKRYSEIGLDMDIAVPDFEKYLTRFIDSSGYMFTNNILYPTNGKWGKNILNSSDTIFASNNYYSMSADLPAGTTLTVKQNGNKGALGYVFGQDNTGWDDLGPDDSMVWRTHKTNRTGVVDLRMHFMDNVTVYVYENGSEKPTRIKRLYKI